MSTRSEENNALIRAVRAETMRVSNPMSVPSIILTVACVLAAFGVAKFLLT